MENTNEIQRQIATPKKKMPGSVIGVIASASVFLALNVIAGILANNIISAFVTVLIWGLILFFFARGGRLSRWLLTIYSLLTIGGLAAAVIVPSISKGFNFVNLLVILVVSSPVMATLAFAYKKSARQYAGLYCPACGSAKVRSGDIMYREVVCKECGGRWK
ncbi:MAG: hypothetical protein LLG37_04065 [Spirochaetia bacterium]|nr:hypothetical protein [Spirochaetia bacterium]